MTTKDEPVEWLTGCPECGMDGGCDCDSGTWNPPANANAGKSRSDVKPWVGLTDEEINKTFETKVWDARRSYARAIEAKLREKNEHREKNA